MRGHVVHFWQMLRPTKILEPQMWRRKEKVLNYQLYSFEQNEASPIDKCLKGFQENKKKNSKQKTHQDEESEQQSSLLNN